MQPITAPRTTLRRGFVSLCAGAFLAAWSAHKQKVNAGKKWMSNVMRKRHYWVKEGARWKILYEGAA
jgi:hypothetical protein